MKNLNKLLMLLTSVALLVNVSCNKNEPEAVNAELTVSGGTSIVVKDKDAEAALMVTAKAPVTNDVTVVFSVTPANGEATIANQEVVIPKGSASVSTKIVFPLSKFPPKTTEMKITVTGISPNPGVTFATASTDFFVSGDGGDVLPTELSITAKSTTINTDEKDGVAELTFMLNKSIAEDLVITYTYDDGKTIADADITWSPAELKITKGIQTLTARVTVLKGKEGKLPIKFAISNKEVTLKTEKIELTFQTPPFPDAPVALCGMTSEYRNYAITKTFTVGDYTLSPEHDVNSEYGVDDMTKKVTANVSNGASLFLQAQNKDDGGAANMYASVMWVDWNRNGKLSDNERIFMEKWAAGPMGGLIAPYNGEFNAPEGTPEGKYYARIGLFYYGNKAADIAQLTGGCGHVESCDLIDIALNYSATSKLTASLSAEGSKDFTVVGKVEKTVTVKLNQKSTSSVTVDLVVSKTGGSGNATLAASSVTIPAGSLTASTKLLFDEINFPMGNDPTFIDVTATTSAPAEINTNASKVTFTARSLGASGTLTSYCKIVEGGYAYATVKGGSVGGVTLRAGDITKYNEYIDYSQDVTNRAKIKEGSEVKVTFLNNGPQGGCGMGDTFEFVVFVDWNKDGDFADAGERYRQDFKVTVPKVTGTQDLMIPITNIPAGAQKISTMRIMVNFVGTKSVDGCQKIESANVYDVAYILE